MSPQLPADAQNRSFIIFVSISEFAKIECENTSTNDKKFIIYSILIGNGPPVKKKKEQAVVGVCCLWWGARYATLDVYSSNNLLEARARRHARAEGG